MLVHEILSALVFIMATKFSRIVLHHKHTNTLTHPTEFKAFPPDAHEHLEDGRLQQHVDVPQVTGNVVHHGEDAVVHCLVIHVEVFQQTAVLTHDVHCGKPVKGQVLFEVICWLMSGSFDNGIPFTSTHSETPCLPLYFPFSVTGILSRGKGKSPAILKLWIINFHTKKYQLTRTL